MRRIAHEALASFGTALLGSVGVRKEEAALISACLVEANLRGTDSHGVLRLPIYIPRFKSGAINPRPDIRVVSERPQAALLDGDNGLGHLVGMRAMDRAISSAREHGIALCAARNSNHFGAASYFSLLAAEASLVGICASNTCPAMPAPGAKAAVVGNGPLAIALPAPDGDHVCLDISTSAGAYGKVLIAAREGKPIPEGWAVDVDGMPTTDPRAAIESQLLLPFAGHKGFGIAFIIDSLCAALGNTWSGHDVPNIYEPGKEDLPGRVSHVFIAISADIFGTGDAFLRKIRQMKDFVREAPHAEGQRPMFPGQLELETRCKRLAEGIPLEPALLVELNRLGQSVGISTLPEEMPV